jgi:hypothetical protein
MLIWQYILFHLRLWYHSTFTPDKFATVACPGCGLVGPKKLRFLNSYQRVIGHCPRCDAEWGIDPAVPHDKWLVQGLAEWQEEQDAKELEKLRAEQKAKLENK